MTAEAAMRQSAFTVEYYWDRMTHMLKEREVVEKPELIASLVRCCVYEYSANISFIDK